MSGYLYQQELEKKWKIMVVSGIAAAANFLFLIETLLVRSRSPLKLIRYLLAPERRHRVHLRGLPRWNQAGQQGHC